jgi:thioester reductase-like protein/acyl-CoA synthetase (AMP-forming)/AMP-acid ligase II
VAAILHDEANANRLDHADPSDRIRHKLNITEVFTTPGPQDLSPVPYHVSRSVTPEQIAYLFHTSGTSSGLPKPIPQSHRGSIVALPLLPATSPPTATFTTTPLYHGGIPDCLRAWMGRSPIWLFPEGTMPITARSVCLCLETIAKHTPPETSKVGYFSSVPYILQLLSDDATARQHLLQMQMVGFGGAGLASSVGDKLVADGVPLISRYGSAECGFLLSSARSFASDKGWNWLRASSMAAIEHLYFEPKDAALVELVVGKGWPLVAKPNREDGGFATADLFETSRGEDGGVKWRYHSRDDAQIVLDNGKKFDPAPTEADILAGASGKLVDVLVFGSGRQYPGALLFARWPSGSVDDAGAGQELVESIWPSIEKMNAASQSHARLDKGMLHVIWVSDADAPPLQKSSKGTIMRRQAEARYETEIKEAYHAYFKHSEVPSRTNGHADNRNWSKEQVLEVVRTIFAQVMGRQIESEKDAFLQGVDSLAATKIRGLLNATFFADEKNTLPMSVVYEQSTIARLAGYIMALFSGDAADTCDADKAATKKAMRAMVERYSKFDNASSLTQGVTNQSTRNDNSEEVILLTGATGLLGAHILNSLRQTPCVAKIYCLVRAASAHEAHDRVSTGQTSRGLQALEPIIRGQHVHKDPLKKTDAPGVICVPWPTPLIKDSLEAHLGIPRLIKDVPTTIIHAAWPVNFTLGLAQFEPYLAATQGLAALALQTKARMVFISSTAAVSEMTQTDGQIPEALLSLDALDTDKMIGYAASKWVAEQICAAAAGRSHAAKDPLPDIENADVDIGHATGHSPGDHELPGSTFDIIRVGQLCGNNQGIWNMSEAFPLMLSTARTTGSLPNLVSLRLDWLAVDVAAQAVCEVALAPGSISRQTATPAESVRGEAEVYHLLAQSTDERKAPNWLNLLEWIHSVSPIGYNIEFARVKTWLGKVEGVCQRQAHPAGALLDFWRKAYSFIDDIESYDPEEETFGNGRYATENMRRRSAAFRDAGFPDREAVRKMWQWIELQEMQRLRQQDREERAARKTQLAK